MARSNLRESFRPLKSTERWHGPNDSNRISNHVPNDTQGMATISLNAGALQVTLSPQYSKAIFCEWTSISMTGHRRA